MDVLWTQDETRRIEALALALKQLRVRRGLRSSEVARAMGIGLRTYQRFEAGERGLDLESIFEFARVVQADPWGIVFAAEFGSESFALHCADNHAASLLLTMLRRFDRRSGKDIAVLDPRSLVSIFARCFEQIGERAQRLNADLEQWMFDETFVDPDPGAD
jgi:transcriptional regulator with XRE-family HTH domain